MKEVILKNKTGKELVLDFQNYSYKEFTFNDFTIFLGSKIFDSFNDKHTVLSIKAEMIVIKDPEGTIHGMPKENLIYYSIVNHEDFNNIELYCKE